jgi:hypothetical protein
MGGLGMKITHDYMLGSIDDNDNEPVEIWIMQGDLINIDTMNQDGDAYLTPTQATQLITLLSRAIKEIEETK